MARCDVSCSLEDGRLRLVEVRGNQVTKQAEVIMESKWISGDGAITHPEAVAKSLQTVMKETQISNQGVACGISGRRALSRVMVLPDLHGATLTGLVMTEARALFPVAIEDFYLSWQTISSAQNKVVIFLTAIPRDRTDSYLQTLKLAGINPKNLYFKPVAMTHLVSQSNAILLDVKTTEFDIVVMVNNVPQILRNIPFGDQEKSVIERAQILVDDINRTILFYNENHPDSPLDPGLPVMITSAPGTNGELSTSIGDLLDRPTIKVVSPFETPDEFDLDGYMTNLALVLQHRAPKKVAPDVKLYYNVLPNSHRPQPISLSRVVGVPLLVVVALCTMYSVWLFVDTNKAIGSIQAQILHTQTMIENRFKEKQALAINISNLEARTGEVNAETESLQTIADQHHDQQESIEDSLSLAVSAIPLKDVDLTGISYQDGNLVITGDAETEDKVIAYARNLSKGRPDAEIIISRISIDQDIPDENIPDEDLDLSEPVDPSENSEPPPDEPKVQFSLSVRDRGVTE